MSPKVSVLMAVFNSQDFLSGAIESILAQTYTDFEFVIINDGSTDQSAEIIASYAEKDKRILVVDNQKNIGLTKSLNKGLSLLKGEYIARMDADDISLPARFEKQVAYLELHPETWVLGGQVEFIDDKGKREKAHSYPVDNRMLFWSAVINGPTVIHPSVMIRRDKLNLVGNYPEDCKLAQDAALWRKFFTVSDFPIANLNDELLLYRRHPASLGSTSRLEQVKMVIKYQTLLYNHILGEQCPAELVTILNFPSRFQYSSAQGSESIRLLLRLFNQFCKKYPLDSAQLKIIKRDVGQKISNIAYRYPIRCASHVLYSIYLYPAVLNDFFQIYSSWFSRKKIPARSGNAL